MKRLVLPSLFLLALLIVLGLQQFEGDRQTSSARRPAASSRFLAVVYPERSPLRDDYVRIIRELQSRSRYWRVRAVPDHALDTLSVAARRLAVGPPEWLMQRRLISPSLPSVRLDQNGFAVAGRWYRQPGDVLLLLIPPASETDPPLTVITGNEECELLRFLETGYRFWHRPGDYSIYRGQALIAYGFLDPQTGAVIAETNFVSDRRRVFADSLFIVEAIGAIAENRLPNFLQRQRQALVRLFARLSIPLRQQTRLLPIRLRLYGSAEAKTLATRNPEFASWSPGDSLVHIVFHDDYRGEDFAAIAGHVLDRWAGGIPNRLVRRGAGIAFSHNWGGEGYRVWAGRLFHAGQFRPWSDVMGSAGFNRPSPLLAGPQLASYIEFLLQSEGPERVRRWLHSVPAVLPEKALPVYFSAQRQRAWQAWCERVLPEIPPSKLPPPTEFIRGFCFAHEGYSVYNGYMGRTAFVSLQRLRELGVNGISVTPFGYIRDPHRPMPLIRSESAGSENDASLVVSAAFARRLGMSVMLKPHILLAGGGHWGWPGDVVMKNPDDWPAFFRHYRDWITHYAMLAQMYRFDLLCVGVELTQVTPGHATEWRELIQHVRRFYGGPLTYAANWGEEFENVAFWEALDFIGVNCYYPLSADSSAGLRELIQGARRVVQTIEAVARTHGKRVLITEIGFASRPTPWVQPYRDGRGARPDPQAQAMAYAAMFEALYDRPWLAGLYWWKWPTVLSDGGPGHAGFTPNGKPAENVVKTWFSRRWPH